MASHRGQGSRRSWNPLWLLVAAGAAKLPARGPDAVQNWMELRAVHSGDTSVARPGPRRGLGFVWILLAVVLVAALIVAWLLAD